MFDLESAILHCEEVAREEIVKGNLLGNYSGSFYTGNKDKCERCAAEHRQLAEWLKELKWWKSLPHYCVTCKYGDMGKFFSECKGCRANSNWTCGYESEVK